MNRLTSRKFITAVAGIVAGVVMALGVDESVVTAVAGAVVSAVSLAVYIITEGKIDETALKKRGEGEEE